MKTAFRVVCGGIIVILCVMQTTQSSCGRHHLPLCDDDDGLDASLYMIRNLRPSDFEIELERSSRNHRHTHLHGDKNCTTAISNHNQTRCPIYYVLNFDPNREPSMIAEARCSCTYCSNNGTSSCIPEYYYRSVMETDQQRNCQRRVVRRFQGGCSCSKAVTYPPR